VLELAILGLLKDQPLHGYELKKRLGETLGFLWGVSYGSLYPALRRLEQARAIEVVAPGREAGPPGDPMPATGSLTGDLAAARGRRLPKPSRRTRKAYRVTDRGQALFAELLAADHDGDDERAFALKFAFCRHLSSDARLELLQRRRADLVERLSKARRSRGPTGLDRYTRSLVEHRNQSTERDLEWVDELIVTEQRASAGRVPRPAASATIDDEQRASAGRVPRPAASATIDDEQLGAASQEGATA
jgi:DNA-binding PadR family transcriptional regulator